MPCHWLLRLGVSAMVRIICAVLLIGPLASQAASHPSIAYVKVVTPETVAHTCTVDLTNPSVKVSVALAKGGVGSSERFKSMIGRTQPIAAITGTFFDTRSLLPTGDIALFGTLVHSGCIGSALCIDSANRATIVPLAAGRKTRWSDYETVLCAGPTLLADGKIAIAIRHEGFRGSLYCRNRRTAVGITKAGKLLLVVVNRKASLYDVAKLMMRLNVVDAVSLDGGSSTAFYHDGRYFAMPFRKLTNCLVVYASPQDYQRAKSALAPSELFTRAQVDRSTAPSAGFILGQLLPPGILSDLILPPPH